MERQEIIDSLKLDTQGIINTVQSNFLNLETERLRQRPLSDQWSIGECIAHLNIADAHNIRQFEHKLKSAQPDADSTIFKPGWLGNYFVKMIKPLDDGTIPSPMKTLRKFVPKIENDENTLHQFLSDQQIILDTLERSRVLNLNKIKITSAIGPIVTFRLGDALRFLIGHNQRHIIQASRVLERI